ncbi:hypothetical protein GIB67_033459 [Kingdonia uniflora]|uniref:F-box domain-containing protein n=1 Tax=Kingdonia uniflora TaxID=39325 RepID=A0A7J7LUA7_9MAGN|nr:hypothetical protein GIB67_033459 [Kingdonia uniflora]
MANWAELPPELIGLVLKRLIAHDVYDYLSFRAVCHPWRSVASEKHNYAGVSVCKIPWLMMAEKENSDVRSFYSLSNNKFYNIHLPEARGRRCWGSPDGWLITLGIDREMHLLNPLTHVQIRLPSQTTFGDQYPEKSSFTSEVVREIFIRKAIQLSTPTSTTNGNCIVIAIYSQWGKLAIAKPTDKTWTTLESPFAHYYDVISFKDQVYAIDSYGILRICDITGIQPNVVDFASPIKNYKGCDTLYLVEISGELHLIIRYVFREEDWEDGEPENNSVTLGTCFFEIYKMDICTRQWEELDGSSEHALFLGTNCSFSLSVAEYPELKGNCVYFTDDDVDSWDCEAGRYTGIYNFENKIVEFIDLGLDMHSTFSPPLWITPNLC